MEGGRTGDLLDGEEGGKADRGKKSHDHRCGKPIEAKPVAGQTCHIELALGALAKPEKETAYWLNVVHVRQKEAQLSPARSAFAQYHTSRIGRGHNGPSRTTIRFHARPVSRSRLRKKQRRMFECQLC